jgi:WD40 repeat protein
MLVNNPSFVKHLRINKERLPSEYERLLAVEAKQLASQYFKELKNTNRTALSAAVTSNEVRPAVDRMTSESTDTEQTFESHLQPLGGIPGILSRGRSFSSVTSFSNDTVEITSPVDSSTGFEDSAAKGTRTLPKRSSRAVQPLYARAKPRRSRRKPNTQRSIAVTPPRIVARSENTTQNESTSYDQKREQGTKSYSRDAVSPLKPATRIERDSATEVAVHGTAPAHKGVSTREFLDPIGYLLIQRELHGMTPVRAQRGQSSFKAVASSYFEDCFVRQSEWTDCSGTILSLTWTSPSAFICGAVAHSDCNHMQYNKPGNLLLGSVNHDTLRAYPDHRLIRPIVSAAQNESNSLEAMRQTQDPWMYSPVVATAHSEKNGYTFTASFDKTVKIWTLTESGSSMKLQGTWVHDDKVNFVAASPHHDRVATASQSMSNAVRVYSLDEDAISESAYDQYCGNKASVQAEEVQRREKWAYYPSTIQWGRAECVKHLLLVGWSPRSDSGDDCDIPDEKRNTGELCLWDILDSSRVPITSAHLQNVFEVIWHPTQPCFLAATSPAGNFDADVTKTQIRLFGQNSYGSFLNNRTFDCPAWDVNELTIMPTSPFEYFITVSCTDRRTYVYDSKRGDAPIHILQHGNSLDEPENEDSGVKFACWGNSPDRFYTGSSDGELIAWNVKAPVGGAHVRTLLRLTGGIYAGSFSKDFSKLIIGDDTGKVHLLAIDDSDLLDPTLEVGDLSLSRMTPDNLVPVKFNRPKLVIPHPEPPPPNADNINIMQDGELSTLQISSRYLERGQLRLFPNSEFPRARKAIYQGPNYSETLLYRFEAHEDYDSTQPLLAKFLEKQQFIVDEQSYRKEQIQEKEKELRLQTIRPPRIPWQEQKAHRANINLDLDFRNLSLSTQRSFNRERVEFEGDFVFDYELMPSDQHVFLGG